MRDRKERPEIARRRPSGHMNVQKSGDEAHPGEGTPRNRAPFLARAFHRSKMEHPQRAAAFIRRENDADFAERGMERPEKVRLWTRSAFIRPSAKRPGSSAGVSSAVFAAS